MAVQPQMMMQPIMFAPPTQPRIHRFRKVFSRQDAQNIRILVEIPPGVLKEGCWVCCPAPSCLPCCSAIPCCGMPQYIKDQIEDSKFIYLTESGLLWNEPAITAQECCGGCMLHPCFYRAQDSIKMIAYDDPALGYIKNTAGCMANCCQNMFGGDGAPLQINQVFCFKMCLPSGACPGCCLPTACGCMPCRDTCKVPGAILKVDTASSSDSRDKIIKVRDAIRQRIK